MLHRFVIKAIVAVVCGRTKMQIITLRNEEKDRVQQRKTENSLAAFVPFAMESSGTKNIFVAVTWCVCNTNVNKSADNKDNTRRGCVFVCLCVWPNALTGLLVIKDYNWLLILRFVAHPSLTVLKMIAMIKDYFSVRVNEWNENELA